MNVTSAKTANKGLVAGDTVALFTAYEPLSNLKTSVLEALKQCSHVVVADNTPIGKRSAKDVLGKIPRVTVIADGTNFGLAKALNRAVSKSKKFEYFFILDQDSAPKAGIVSSLRKVLERNPDAGVAGPAPWDETNKRFIDPRTHSRKEVSEMPVIITSAMLIRKSAFEATSGFREDFFVDCVDQEFCLQLRRAGWKVLQDKNTLLAHSLGDMKWHGFGPFKLRATHHPAWRLYWAARNGVILSREYWSFDRKWSSVNLAILGYWALTVSLFEKNRIAKLAALARGCLDGLAGKTDNNYLPVGASL